MAHAARSVDVDEPTNLPPPPRSYPPRPLVAAASRLSPLQQAYSDYTRHASSCLVCRDVDAGPCPSAERLWKAYRAIGDDACGQVADGAR
jgi:hypothetical protein